MIAFSLEYISLHKKNNSLLPLLNKFKVSYSIGYRCLDLHTVLARVS